MLTEHTKNLNILHTVIENNKNTKLSFAVKSNTANMTAEILFPLTLSLGKLITDLLGCCNQVGEGRLNL